MTLDRSRFAHGLVVGKFSPLHAGHSHLITSALRACDRVTVEVLGSSVESIPLVARAAWVREAHPTARVVAAIDDTPVDFESDASWEAHTALISSLAAGPVDAVFTNDPYGAELAGRLGAEWVQIDPTRELNPVSTTAVRADPWGHWHELAPAARAHLAARVVVVGAGSTGTTTLAAALAEALGTLWVPEYGREYTGVREGGPNAPWRSDEFDLVVDRQLALEQTALRRVPVPLLVCDTDVLATTVKHERDLGHAAARLEARAAEHRPVLYVLTGDEIPFGGDGVCDDDPLRRELHERFREVLAETGVPWIEVRGDVEARIVQALPAIQAAVRARLDFAPPRTAVGAPAGR